MNISSIGVSSNITPEKEAIPADLTQTQWGRFFETLDKMGSKYPKSKESYSLLQVATIIGDDKLCKLLIEQKFDPNDTGSINDCPLFLLCVWVMKKWL